MYAAAQQQQEPEVEFGRFEENEVGYDNIGDASASSGYMDVPAAGDDGDYDNVAFEGEDGFGEESADSGYLAVAGAGDDSNSDEEDDV
jgi:hypothetical protein